MMRWEEGLERRNVWLRFFAEGAVIVTSILLAFGLQAWWEGRQELREERAYLESLQGDFRQSHVRALEHVSANERTLSSAGRLLQVLGQPRGEIPSDTLASLLEDSFWIWTFSPVLATYQDMVNSGDLRLLQNEELRIALSEFEEQVQVVDRLDQTLWEHWLRFDLPFLKDHYVLSDIYEGYRGSADLKGVDVRSLEYGESRFEPDHEAIRTRSFYNILVARTVAHQDAIVNMKVALAQIELVLHLVETDLQQRWSDPVR
jgi:hypothetical protein